MKSKKFNSQVFIKKIIVAFIGIMFIGFGVAINSAAKLGNDPVAVLYDGFKNFASVDLGTASSIVNGVLFLVILIADRHYINVGTFLYTFMLGVFVNLGTSLYSFLRLPSTLTVRILSSILGYSFLFLGVAIYIVVDVGLDTWNGLTVILSEKFSISYKFVKIALDLFCLIVGVLLGGVMGVTTVLAAFVGGPMIEKIRKTLDKTLVSWIKIKRVSSE